MYVVCIQNQVRTDGAWINMIDSKSDSLNTETEMTADVVWSVWFIFSIATGNF